MLLILFYNLSKQTFFTMYRLNNNKTQVTKRAFTPPFLVQMFNGIYVMCIAVVALFLRAPLGMVTLILGSSICLVGIYANTSRAETTKKVVYKAKPLPTKEVSIFTTDEPRTKPTKKVESKKVAPNVKTTPTKRTNEYAPVDADELLLVQTKAFIKKYEGIAKAEMKKTGIPASIKMAQAIIESRAGTSRLAKNNNNHFGIKCFSRQCYKGHCTNHFDDHHKDFFRKFKKAQESWAEHSRFLQRERYKDLFTNGKDYKKWAVGLKKAGYATDKEYAQKLIRTIEKFGLQTLDKTTKK